MAPSQKKSKAILGLLDDCLVRHFDITDPKFHRFIENNSEYLDLVTGDTLITQGEYSDDVYFLLSGRLRALITNSSGEQQPIGEIGRGETVGEMAVFTGKARSASVVAIRDSVVAKISRQVLTKAISKQPELALKITRQIIDRYERMNAVTKGPSRAINLTILPLTDDVDYQGLIDSLVEYRCQKGDNIIAVSSDYVASHLGTLSAPDVSQPRGPVSLGLSDLEAAHDGLYFVANGRDLIWAETAIHHSDEVILLADARKKPDLTELERALLPQEENLRARITLVLVHEANTLIPQHSSKWLSVRKVARHVHIRRDNAEDMARLSRIIAGRAIGLVLSGGGARGFAHLGTYKALCEAGIKIDMIGGTSAGVIMGSWMALDVPGQDIIQATRDVFVNSPFGNISGDYNLLPLVSLIKGKRAWKATEGLLKTHAGGAIDLEDSWKTFFCIASNYSVKKEMVLQTGDFATNMIASFSIPGVMPPLLKEGELLFDGGIFNNFPVDRMRALGAGKIIGIDLMSDKVYRHDIEATPSSWAILRDKLRPKHKRKYRIPSLANTMLTSLVVTSMSRQQASRDQVDMIFNPNVSGVTMLDWKKYDLLVERSYEEAKAQIAQLTEDELSDYLR